MIYRLVDVIQTEVIVILHICLINICTEYISVARQNNVSVYKNIVPIYNTELPCLLFTNNNNIEYLNSALSWKETTQRAATHQQINNYKYRF